MFWNSRLCFVNFLSHILIYICVCKFLLVDIKQEQKKKKKDITRRKSYRRNQLKTMKLIRVTFLLCALTFLFLITSTSAAVTEKIMRKMAPRKLMIISSEHDNVRDWWMCLSPNWWMCLSPKSFRLSCMESLEIS